ncbi:MAG: flagellar hook-length control protein FliK, partial [Campylobacterota bacterium]|nr:flagellar hook-length control protein FliK [Campylobacterota bacterium]
EEKKDIVVKEPLSKDKLANSTNSIIDSSRLLNKMVLEKLNKEEVKSPDMIKQEIRENLTKDKKTISETINISKSSESLKQSNTTKSSSISDIIDKSIKENVSIRDNISKTEVKSIKEEKVENGEKVVVMNVSKDVVETIQNKIIGAQQKVGHFMSETARNMYLNYQAPMNAFRISLNPANLGTIAIVMRSNKVDNSISISMNMSNPATMDMFTDSKSLLQSALGKNFNENSNINLSFGMQDNNSDKNSQQFSQNQNSDNYNESNENSSDNKKEDINSDELLEDSNQYA